MNKFFFTLIFLLTMAFGWSQVSGIVTDGNFPIEGAIIEIEETGESTLTDRDGNYTIDAIMGQTLLFYTIDGLEEKRIVDANVINIVLSSIVQLNEVVAIGYGTQQRELVSSAVSSIDTEAIMENNPINVSQALQGKASGVQVNQTSGAPGSSPTIRIRGITTNGDNSPLIILDGVNMGTDISVIDPNDIEKIDIVKDASTAIYGVQGQNGVILITSKSGKKNKKTQFTYNGNYSIQEAQNLIELMNAQQYAGYWNESEIADGNSLPFPNFQNFTKGTDWQSQLFTTAPSMSHFLSAQGGGEKISYGLSGSILNQDGIIAPEKSNYQRWTFKNNLDVDLTDNLKVSTLLLYTNVKNKTIPEAGRGSVLYYAYNASPLDPVYDGSAGDRPSNGFNYINARSQEMVNPMAVIANTFNQTDVKRLTGKMELNWEPLDKLTLTSRYNFNYATVGFRGYSPLSYYGPGKVNNNVTLVGETAGTPFETFNLDRDGNGIRDVFSTMSSNNQEYYDYSWESFANYKVNLGVNHFDFLLGSALRNERGNGTYSGGYLTINDGWENATLNNTTSNIPDESYAGQSLFNTGYFKSDYRTVSFFSRIQYDYANKYLLSAILRRDASNKFGPNNRVGYFPSISAGWVVSKEDFFNVEAINNFKIRGSWGITGNDKIDLNGYLALMQNPAEADYPFGNTLMEGSAIGRLGNPDLKWETTDQIDLGFDLSLWNRSFDLTFDYFIKQTKDLLLSPDIAAIVGSYAPGSGLPLQNIGDVRNTGVELNLSYNHKFNDDFSFNTGFNFLYLDNEVTKTNGGDAFGGFFGLSGLTSRMTVGQPLGAFYGLVADGIFQNQSEVDAHAYQQGAQPGDIRYLDLDGDGVISFGSENDIKMIGNPIPKVTLGYNLGTQYKAFDAGISLYASLGNDVVRAYERFQPLNNRSAYYLNRWTGEGTSNEVPRASNAAARNSEFSTFYVEDGSYLRIQNVQVGYDFGSLLGEKSGFIKARLYFAVNNLYTFTNYLGYTPEINNSNPLAAGVDGGQYPTVRTFVTGLTLNF